MLIMWGHLCGCLCFWWLVDTCVKTKSRHTQIVSLIHSIIVVITSITIMTCVPIEKQVAISRWLYSLSTAYFIYDLGHSWTQPVFMAHHLVSIILGIATHIYVNVTYVPYTNLLFLMSEMTAPCQNYYFLQKKVYGHRFRWSFYRHYTCLFLIFAFIFTLFRFIVAPLVLVFFLPKIQEGIYWWIIVASSCGLITGSLLWMRFQLKVVIKMNHIMTKS